MRVLGGSGLFGREHELGMIGRLVGSLAGHAGGALVIRGESGAGKSALLSTAEAAARRRQLRVLSLSCARPEAGVSFAGLHRLLQPLLPRADGLPSRQRHALLAAFGLADRALDPLGACLAALELISADPNRPTLAIVDDAQWLDDASGIVLSAAARRLSGQAGALLVAMGDAYQPRFDATGLAEVRLGRLTAAQARAMLDDRASHLRPPARDRILDLAAGNPLALTELPATELPLTGLPLTGLPFTGLPFTGLAGTDLEVTERLRQSLTAPLSTLPPATRSLLTVAAADAGGSDADSGVTLAELLGASSIVAATDLGLDAISPAIGTGIVEVRRHALGFTHPCLPAAIYQTATIEGRHAAHAALAQALGRRPGRQVWHQATAALGPDSEIAVRLDRTATQAERHGATGVALAAIQRAAELSTHPADHRRRMLRAAELAFDCGDPDHWWGNPDGLTRSAISTAADRMPLAADDPVLLATLACTDPIRHGAAVSDLITRKAIAPADPAGMYLTGLAATAAGDHHSSLGFLCSAVAGLRSQGRHRLLAQALACQAWAAVHLTRGGLATRAAHEAIHLARQTGQRRLAVTAQLAMAAIVAQRGKVAEIDPLTSNAMAGLAPDHATCVPALAQFVRGRGAVVHQRYAQAAAHLRRALEPADPASHPVIGAWGLADLVEAMTHIGERDGASVYLHELESLARFTRSPLHRAHAAYAGPLLAAEGQAEELCRATIDHDLADWPCLRARMLLRYGRWLRRKRRVAESRVPLRTALDSFEALALGPLAECARRELRASGERRQRPGSADQLTAQELQIARLAADGLSNREIGQQLCISHRTVGYHLHRVFPKLAITSRSQLHAALNSPSETT